MRILISAKTFHPNSLGIVNGFLKQNHEVEYFVHKSSLIKQPQLTIKPKVVPYNGFFRFIILKITKSTKRVDRYCPPKTITLMKKIRCFNPDVIILKSYTVSNIFVYLLGKMFRVRSIVLLTDHPFNSKKILLGKIFSKIGLIPNLKIHTAEKYSGSIDENQSSKFISSYLPYPIDDDMFKTIDQKNDKTISYENRLCKIIYVGSFNNARKRPTWILNAIFEKKIHKNTYVTFVGLGNEESPAVSELRRLAKENDYENHINIEFNVPHHKMVNYYRNHDLFILPAENEPFGAVVTEALASGLPIICSDTCGAKAAVKNGFNGFVFKTNDFEEFKDRLYYLCNNEKELILFGKRSFELAKQNYSSESWVSNFLKLTNI